MKVLKNKLLILLFLFATHKTIQAQDSHFLIKKFTLDNGLTVILNPDPSAIAVYGAMAVKAGSKNDPKDATGMAHYLEHLLFKGTIDLGTTDYAKEKPFLDSIVYYYDLLGKTTDDKERKRIQKLINQQSVQSAKYANPTEFDKLIKSIGGTGLNAFTSNDMTVYHNAFPGEQIEKWLELYAHRFQNPVFRSFQSELEVVYEEKNRSMDSPFNRVFEEFQAALFKTHPYGTQSTIGTVEHLKNPSLTKMYKYFNDYYVANNMGLIISGNFDVALAERVIKDKFSKLRSAPVPEFPNYPNSTFEKIEKIKVKYTPIKIGALGFKTFGNNHPDASALEICNGLLSNRAQTGYLDKLQMDGKVLGAAVMNMTYNDDGANMMYVVPKLVGQSFEEAEALLLAEVEKIKKGEFSDTLLENIKQSIAITRKQELENEQNRCMTLVYLFCQGSSWEKYTAELERINALKKEDIIQVAKKYFTDTYLVYNSSTGFPKKETLDKPGFEPVVTDQKVESAYATRFLSDVKLTDNPRILDYEKDAKLLKVNGSDFYLTKNPYNDIFSLQIVRGVGKDSIPHLEYALDLFDYFYTKDLNRDALKKEFDRLGVSTYAWATNNRTTFYFSGLEKNLQTALPLIRELIYAPKVDQKSLETIVEQIKNERKSELKDPNGMGRMLLDYALKGKASNYLSRLPIKEVEKLKADSLVSIFKQTEKYATTYHFTGNIEESEIVKIFEKQLPPVRFTKQVPHLDEAKLPINKNQVLLMGNNKVVQSQIYYLLNTPNFSGETRDKVLAEAFNNYVSDGFSGLLMQEIREYRSLAYATGGSFIAPIQKNKPGYFYAYIGCQVDKTNEAVGVLDSIMKHLPQKPERIDLIRSGLINSITSNYPNFRSLSPRIAYGKELGYSESPLKKEFELYKNLQFNDINRFYEQNILHRPRIITIYGNLKKIDLKQLQNFGEIQKLRIKDIRID